MPKATHVYLMLFYLLLTMVGNSQIIADSSETRLKNVNMQDAMDQDTMDANLPNIQEQTTNNSAVFDFFIKLDTLDVYRHGFFRDSINYSNRLFIDTTNHNSADYDPSGLFSNEFNNLGIIGSAHESRVFSTNNQMGFNAGISSNNGFIWSPANIQLYDVKTPFTELFYLMGSKRENVLKFTHAQSFLNQQVSLNMNFRLFNHLGAYKRQKTDVKNFIVGGSYQTVDKRYHFNAQYYHNKLVLQENGGLENRSDFEENLESNREVIAINLSNAANLIRISGAAVTQNFYFSKSEPDLSAIPDTNIIDFKAFKVTHYKKPYFDPVSHLGKLSHYFNYERQNFKYTDSDQSSTLYNGLPFYPTYDSTSYTDTIGLRKYVNELTYSNSDYKDFAGKPKWINFFFGARHEYTQYFQSCQKTDFQNYAIIGGVFVNFAKQLSLSSDFAYYQGDHLANDFYFGAKVFIKIKSNLFTGGLQLTHKEPDIFYKSFHSSRFFWNNNLSKTDIQNLHAKFDREKLYLNFSLQNIINYVYIDQTLQPVQYTGNIQYLLLLVRKDFRLGPWGSDISMAYQKVSVPTVIRVPDFTGKARLFYFNEFFNKALDLEIGLEFNYFTSYYANKYMPALRLFHLQDDQTIGDYIFMDAYLNAKIGKARLFVRYDHFNAGLMDYNYYSSPGYPAQDAAFRFGVNWILFN
jgi:hypothetical protein